MSSIPAEGDWMIFFDKVRGKALKGRYLIALQTNGREIIITSK